MINNISGNNTGTHAHANNAEGDFSTQVDIAIVCQKPGCTGDAQNMPTDDAFVYGRDNLGGGDQIEPDRMRDAAFVYGRDDGFNKVVGLLDRYSNAPQTKPA